MTDDIKPRYSETLEKIATALDIPITKFFDELRENMAEAPLTDLSQYLIGLSNGLEESDEGARFHDTRIRSAAIMLETLEGRALAYAAENDKLRERIKDLESNFKELAEEAAPRVEALEHATDTSGRRPVQVFDGYEYHIGPGVQMHKGGYDLVMVPAGGEMYGDQPSTWGEGVIVKRLWDEDFINTADPTPEKGVWKITHSNGKGAFEARLYVDRDLHDNDIKKLEDLINAERLTIRNQQIALDAKDQRIIEMEEENNSYQEVQRDRARLLEENQQVDALRKHTAELQAWADRLQDANQQLADKLNAGSTDESHGDADSRALHKQNKKLRKAIKALI